MICTVKITNWRQENFYYGEDSDPRPRKIPFIKDLKGALSCLPGGDHTLRVCKEICDAFYATGDGEYPITYRFDCKHPERYAQFIKGVFLSWHFDVSITYMQEVEL